MGLFLGNFVAFMLIGVPIALALAVACMAYLLITDKLDLLLAFPQHMVAGTNVFILLTIPLFVLAGNLMNAGGITDRIVDCARALVGHIRGGLSLVNVVASMFFGGVSGAATADSSALGTVLIPAMVREGYDKAYAAALTAVSSVIGPIIPPSIAMIIYGVLSSTSIAKLFLAGIVPGLLLGFSLLGYAWYVAKKRGYPTSPKPPMAERAVAVGRAIPALLLPVIILGGILSGVFTPTESAAVAVIYAFLVSMFLYRTLKLREIGKPLGDSVVLTSAIMLIAAVAKMVAIVFAYDSIPAEVAKVLLSISDDPIILLLLINGFLLFLGLFLEPLAAMILALPVLLEIVGIIGVDKVHFGIIVVLNLVIGLATPPVGLCLFIVCAIGKVSLEAVSKASLPMLGICVIVLLLVTFFPDLVLFIPSLFETTIRQ
jgi:tripartite ATP-independent transporter DctM subunit